MNIIYQLLTTEKNLIANLQHAEYLSNNFGSCAYYGEKCDECFVKPLLKKQCIKIEALRIARKYIEDNSHGNIKCHSIWED